MVVVVVASCRRMFMTVPSMPFGSSQANSTSLVAISVNRSSVKLSEIKGRAEEACL